MLKFHQKMKKARSDSIEPEWTEVGRGRLYVPTQQDIGCSLKLVCVPSDGERDGEEIETISSSEVIAGPEFCPFEKRHEYTKNLSGHGA